MASRDLQDWMALLTHELGWMSGEMTGRSPVVARQREWTPRIDLLEGETFLLLRAELAGVARRGISLTYNAERHSLILRGERRQDDLAADCRCVAHLLEIEYGEFAREIPLPEGAIEPSEARTMMKAGMLYVVLPKKNDGHVRFVLEETFTIFRS